VANTGVSTLGTAECVRLPLVPFTVTVYVPFCDAEVFRVAVPDPVTVDGVIVAVSPCDPVAVRLTVPENWFIAVTLIVVSVSVPE